MLLLHILLICIYINGNLYLSCNKLLQLRIISANQEEDFIEYITTIINRHVLLSLFKTYNLDCELINLDNYHLN